MDKSDLLGLGFGAAIISAVVAYPVWGVKGALVGPAGFGLLVLFLYLRSRSWFFLRRLRDPDRAFTKRFLPADLTIIEASLPPESQLIHFLTVAKATPIEMDSAADLLVRLLIYYVFGGNAASIKKLVIRVPGDAFEHVPGPYSNRIREWVEAQHPRWIKDIRFER